LVNTAAIAGRKEYITRKGKSVQQNTLITVLVYAIENVPKKY
jgi:hypothetical protein